jgi:hypothetical protein
MRNLLPLWLIHRLVRALKESMVQLNTTYATLEGMFSPSVFAPCIIIIIIVIT